LVATYHGENEDKHKLITVSPLYSSQFTDELICNERSLYTIQKSKDDTLKWKKINTGSRKINKMKNKTTLRSNKK
jgi:hypothetical protein